MTAPRGTVVRRALRWFVLGSGPLKRGSDRVQVVGRLVVVVSFLVAPPNVHAPTPSCSRTPRLPRG